MRCRNIQIAVYNYQGSIMNCHSKVLTATFYMCVLSIAGCDRSPSGGRAGPTEAASKNDVNLYIWTDYLAPNTLSSFEKATGVKVHVAYFENNETLEAKMLTGHSGFDVVFPTAPFLQRDLSSGAYRELDKKLLPNLVNLDRAIMARTEPYDPGSTHGVIYTWGTFGIGYNEKLLAALEPRTAVDSWRLVFDPHYASLLAKCGINILDAPAAVVRIVLNYLGRNPNSPTSEDLAAAEALLMSIRPYVRNIDSTTGTEALANGDVCIVLEYNLTTYQARHRALEARNGHQVDYAIPKEGSIVFFGMVAIPRDAPHVANAHLFINYLMNPQVIADVSNYIGNANANAAATALLDPSIAADHSVYPPEEIQRRLFLQLADSPEQSRAITRLWQKFKTGH